MADTLEEVEVKIDEDEMLTLSTSHPQKNHEHLNLFPTSSELLTQMSNFKIRAFKKWLQDKFEGSPTN